VIFLRINTTGIVRLTQHLGAFTKPFIPGKSNKYFVFLCVCRGGRIGECVRACVGVGEVARACSLINPACSVQPYCHLRSFWLHHISRHYLINGTIFEKKKKVTEHKISILIFFLELLFETFLILTTIQQSIVIKVKKSSCKVPIILVGF
jgi:hypothetical protein